MPRLKILIVPCVEKGKGGGHLARSIRLAQELRSLGKEAWVYTKGGQEFTDGDAESGTWDAVILDRFRTPAAEFARWRKIAPIVGLDEGGGVRKNFDFLLDALPNLEKHKPNIANPCFLFSQDMEGERLEKAPTGKPRVIVTFGAEDTAGLTAPISVALLQRGFAVTAVFGALNQTSAATREKLRESGVEIWENVENLGVRLRGFALVLTHYGLTAFESLSARAPVLLVSPTRYHEKLARKAGFLTVRLSLKKSLSNSHIKDRLPGTYSLLPFVENCNFLCKKYRADRAESLAEFLARIEIHGTTCPVCGNKPANPPGALARFSNRTYRICPACRIVFMSRLAASPVQYNQAYFFDAYKRQYGKTYLEDFSHLVELGMKRLVHIKKILGKPRSSPQTGTDSPKQYLAAESQLPTLFDVGCAYGPFLVAAAQSGFAPVGLEPAKDAASYVQNTLHIPCYNAVFPIPLEERFDAVTLWFVIEHFEKTGEVFTEINKLLKPKGVLAFSTPSFAGISARKSQKNFLENSPLDHYAVFDPRTIRALLKRFGFSVRKIATTGVHPERFPLLGKFTLKRPRLRAFLSLSIRLFRMGDTFEVYAVKKEKPE
ncbi:MAG: methyltransferase domain-containing protein [Treponema sp.]|jgi:2-polyprenyl-3-methyl-5-hydroxy-6-metoxy-1,4-benzoquinol methylase|nr:methyltransferase domain-containing protein [Treponema sp.]